MVTILTGENSFALQAELSGITTAFVAEYGDFGLERLDGEEASYERMAESLTSMPMLTNKKLVILRAPSKNKTFSEKFEQLLSETAESTDVVVVEPKLDKRLSYYKYLKKQPGFHEFPELDPHGTAQWLSSAAKAQGGLLSLADARLLVERSGANQQLLAHELEKLLLYDPNISRQSIELLTDQTPQSTIFQLLEAAFAGNRKRALELYAEQRALKVEPAKIIAMLTWQLHVLSILKTAGDRSSNQIAREAKLNPYVVEKSQSIARALSLPSLKRLIADLLSIDVRTKRTNLDPDEALQHYLLAIAES